MNEKLTYIGTIKFLISYIQKYKVNFILFFVGWLCDTAITVFTPAILGVLIDEIVYYKNMDTFINVGLAIFVLLLFSCILYFFIYAQHQYLMGMYTKDIKKDIFRHWQESEAEYLTDSKTGDAITMIQSYSHECLVYIVRNVIHFINGIVKLMISVTYLLLTNWKIGLLIMGIAPICVYLNAAIGEKIKKYGYKQKEYYGSYIGWLYEILSSLREIRMLGAKNKVDVDLSNKQGELFRIDIKTKILFMTSQNAIGLVNLAGLMAVYIISGILASEGQLTVGTSLVFLTLFAVVIDQVGWTSSAYVDSQNRISNIQHVYNFMNTPTEKNREGCKNISIGNGDVKFDNVSFSYKNGKTIIKNLSLFIGGGQSIAIVGQTGCGKTTLVNMLLGLYVPEKGSIYIDGENIQNYSLYSLRNNIGIVSQDVYIFEGTIRDNIVFGKIDANNYEIEEACIKANILNDIRSLPNGFETLVGENGIDLSGGQKQRIAIARVFLKNSKIIIFDEATSALDEATESVIFSEWNNLLLGRTAIVIAHRLKAVTLCDRVALMVDGKIKAIDSAEQMMKHNIEFKKLFSLQ